MTVQELLIELQQMNPDAEVRIAFQPSWPLEYSIGSVVEVIENRTPDMEMVDPEEFEFEKSIIYIAEGRQIGYLDKEACEELGW